MLNQVARNMRQVAKERPLSPPELLGKRKTEWQRYCQKIEFKGIVIGVQLTLTNLGSRKAWNLVIRPPKGHILSDAVVQELVEAFLPDEGTRIPLKSRSIPNLVQFMQYDAE